MKKFKNLFWIGFVVVGAPIFIVILSAVSAYFSNREVISENDKIPTTLYDTIKVEKKVIIYDTVRVEKMVIPKKIRVIADSNLVVKDTINNQ